MRQALPLSLAAIGFTGLSALAGAPAQALTYETILGPEVSGATGTGSATVQIIEASNQMKVNIAFSGLSGNTTVAHIHGPTVTAGTGTAGVMTSTPSFLGFPAGVSSGSYEETFDLLATTTYRIGFITNNGGTTAGARDALLAALLDGKAYLNVHSTTFPGGEIRGFFAPAPVPPAQVPAPLPLLGAGAALGWSRRLRQRLASSSR